jgi:hypothetical protein
MVHSRQIASIDKVVLQAPFAFACHTGNIDTLECPDALIVNDFEASIEELKYREYAGIALLIDEADCLGNNVSLLQMFRNIFQIVDRCSLLLAGTEAVFPALSEVFSPIPRQFHRIDVKGFSSWLETMMLVRTPLVNAIRAEIGPELGVIEELHLICGGDPAEAQLYCHHMYRSVEDGSSSISERSWRVQINKLRKR